MFRFFADRKKESQNPTKLSFMEISEVECAPNLIGANRNTHMRIKQESISVKRGTVNRVLLSDRACIHFSLERS